MDTVISQSPFFFLFKIFPGTNRKKEKKKKQHFLTFVFCQSRFSFIIFLQIEDFFFFLQLQKLKLKSINQGIWLDWSPCEEKKLEIGLLVTSQKSKIFVKKKN